jgi:hypothetical protein
MGHIPLFDRLHALLVVKVIVNPAIDPYAMHISILIISSIFQEPAVWSDPDSEDLHISPTRVRVVWVM